MWPEYPPQPPLYTRYDRTRRLLPDDQFSVFSPGCLSKADNFHIHIYRSGKYNKFYLYTGSKKVDLRYELIEIETENTQNPSGINVNRESTLNSNRFFKSKNQFFYVRRLKF